MNKKVLIAGGIGVAYFLLKGRGTSFASTPTSGRTTLPIGTNPNIARTLYPDGSVAYRLPNGQVISATPGRASVGVPAATIVATASAALTIALKLLSLLGGKAVTPVIKAILPNAQPIVTPYTSGWENTSAYQQGDTLVFSDGTVLLGDGTVIAPDGSIILGSFATSPPIGVDPGADLVTLADLPSGIASSESSLAVDLTQGQLDGIYAVMQQRPLTDLFIVRVAEDGSIVLNTGEVIGPNGLVMAPGTSSTEILGWEVIQEGQTDNLLNFAADSLGTSVESLAASVNSTVIDLTGMTVSELLGVIGPVLSIAGIALTIMMGDTHSPAGQQQMATSLVASIGGGITAAIFGGSIAGGVGVIVAIPLILGAIFGTMDQGGADLDPYMYQAISSGYVAALSDAFAQLQHAYSLADFQTFVGLTGSALDSAMSSSTNWVAAMGTRLGIPSFAWRYFSPEGMLAPDGLTDAWTPVRQAYVAAVQRAAAESAAQLAAEQYIALQLASKYNAQYLAWVAALPATASHDPNDPALLSYYQVYQGSDPYIATGGVTVPPDTVIQQYYQDTETGAMIPVYTEQPGVTIIDAPNLYLLPDGRWVDYQTYVEWNTAYNQEFLNTGG